MEESLDKFSSLLQVNLEQVLLDFDNFVKKDFPVIVSYYKGEQVTVPSLSLHQQSVVFSKVNSVYNGLSQNSSFYTTSGDWEMYNLFEEIYLQSKTIENIPKYLRVIKGNKSNLFPHGLHMNQTLEDVGRKIMDSSDWVNSSLEIGFQNKLREEDYDLMGGQPLLLPMDLSGSRTFFINSVLSEIDFENIYGVDIDRNFEFKDNDLKTLTHDETIFQSVVILSTLRQGDNPEFPDDGIQTSVFIGGTYSIFNFPVLERQMMESFMTDDTLTSFKVDHMEFKGDSFLLTFTVETIKGNSLKFTEVEMLPTSLPNRLG